MRLELRVKALLLPGELGKNKLSYDYVIKAYLYCSSNDVIVERNEVIGKR